MWLPGCGRSLSLAVIIALSCAPDARADISINAGGGATGSYVSDRYFSGGSAYTFGNQTGVYNTERWSSSQFSYAIPVTPGQVEVTLRFRESCSGCGTRTFKVTAEGQVVLSNYTVAVNSVGDRTFTVASDATLNLVFTRVAGEAWVNAIEVRQLGASTSPAPTLSLTASPTSVSSGSASTLTWSSSNATSCTASGAWSGSKAVSGSQSTGPLTATSTFRLDCSGSGGTASKSTTVSVGSAPTVSLTAAPATVPSGGTSTLTWSSTNATSCTASGGWTGTKATSGSATTAPLTATTVFTLACTGASGSTSTSTTVAVSAATGTLFPLRVDPGKRYLVDAQGAPFLVHGDTAWSLVVQLKKPDVDAYLEDRRQRGFNAILVNLLEHYFATNPPANAYGDRPFLTTGDFSTPNERYFAHAEYVIARAAEKGILVMLTPAYMGFGGGSQGWYTEMKANGATKLRAYGRYLGNRYIAHDNILWVHGGDYNPPDRTILRAVVDGIRDIDGRWLHTFHGSRGTTALEFGGSSEPWIQVNNIYTNQYTVVSEAFQEYARSTMPIFMIEGVYEKEGVTGAGVRQQAYHAVLSGAPGQFSGNRNVWRFNSYWQGSLSHEGARTMTHLRILLEGLPWSDLVPDTNGTFVTAGVGTGSSRTAAAVVADRSQALVYLPTVRTITIDLGQLVGPRVKARWYDPSSGGYTTVPGSPFAAGVSRTVTPPGSNAGGAGDWVLVLESVP